MIGMCIQLNLVCNGVQNCPLADDENPRKCYGKKVSRRGRNGRAKRNNIYSGAGFMFRVGKIRVEDYSEARLFDQQSGNQKY